MTLIAKYPIGTMMNNQIKKQVVSILIMKDISKYDTFSILVVNFLYKYIK